MQYAAYRSKKNSASGKFQDKRTALDLPQEKAKGLFNIAKSQELQSPDASIDRYSYEFFITRSDGETAFLYSNSSNG